MARPRRSDDPDTWHHVVNRGTAKRTMFEMEQDARTFLALLACRVRQRHLRLACFCLMATHYHLLVCGPGGTLSGTMQDVQTKYSRYFNRSRRRDGPLVRGRFFSKPVHSLAYRRLLVRYIDYNPVAAGLVRAPADHRFGSARHYASMRGPPWLDRSWIEAEVCDQAGLARYDPASYGVAFGRPSPGLVRLVELRRAWQSVADPLEGLVGGSPASALSWMRWKARLADGTEPCLPVTAPEEIRAVLSSETREPWRVRMIRKECDGWLVAQAGLLRDLSGSTAAQIARSMGLSRKVAIRLCESHTRLLSEDQDYAERASRLAARAIELTMSGGS